MKCSLSEGDNSLDEIYHAKMVMQRLYGWTTLVCLKIDESLQCSSFPKKKCIALFFHDRVNIASSSLLVLVSYLLHLSCFKRIGISSVRTNDVSLKTGPSLTTGNYLLASIEVIFQINLAH